MSITSSTIRWPYPWTWDGGHIIHEAIVPSSRPIVGQRTGGYPIDVREFLVSERNAVMHRTLQKDIRAYIERIAHADPDLFYSREKGSFDHRASIIAAFVGSRIAYHYGGKADPWQFPDETLSLRRGDCEDRALLIASLLLASGISSFNVRVALGHLRVRDTKGRTSRHGHCWVMYKDEDGQWLVIEPTQARTVSRGGGTGSRVRPVSAAYEPIFLFNDVHLWGVERSSLQSGRPINLKRDWSQVDPTFAGVVHRNILKDALSGTGCPEWASRHLMSKFISTPFGVIDAVDVNPFSYDPREHFDNGYIDQSWALVEGHLNAFGKAPTTHLNDFFYAAHGIADFYAHSSYGHFGAYANGELVPFNRANPQYDKPLDYGPAQGFDLAAGRFTTNPHVWRGTPKEAISYWNGHLISGRYAQHKDPSTKGPEHITAIPRRLKNAPGFRFRGALPHHNEMAVDEESGSNALYPDPAEYARQYKLRRAAAVKHIRQEFVSRWP